MADGSYLKTKGKDTKKKELYHYNSFPSSGYQDSNLGPPAPKAGALTGLRYIPNHIRLTLSLLSDSNQRPRDYKSRALAN